MDVIGDLLGWVLTLFLLVLIARLILDWVVVLSNPSRGAYRARTLTHAVTEPVVSPLRRVLRPIRAGGVSIDLAFTVVFVLVLILRQVAFSL
jgi:YggT family protein